MEKTYIKEIKNIIKTNGEVDMENYELDILFNKVFGKPMSNYNYEIIGEMGVIELCEGKSIILLAEEGCMVKQDGLGEEFDLVMMGYDELSEKVLSKIWLYLSCILPD